MQTTAFVLIARPAGFFPAWEEYSAREQALCYYSDTHKSHYGFRPRGGIVASATAGQIIREEKRILRAMEAERLAEVEREKARVRELNRKAHLARVAARKFAQAGTLAAIWPA